MAVNLVSASSMLLTICDVQRYKMSKRLSGGAYVYKIAPVAAVFEYDVTSHKRSADGKLLKR